MRGTAAREPYWPWESRPGDTDPSRNVEVSWSESKDSATQTRAPSFQRAGWSERPARTFSTARRHRGSAQAQEGSRSGSCGLMALSIMRERAEVKLILVTHRSVRGRDARGHDGGKPLHSSKLHDRNCLPVEALPWTHRLSVAAA